MENERSWGVTPVPERLRTLSLSDLDNVHASSGNSLLSVVMQLSMSLGVAAAGALLIGPDQAWMTTEQFFEAVRENLETRMASWA